MAKTARIQNMYEDKEKTKVVYPTTVTSAVYDQNGKPLDKVIEDIELAKFPNVTIVGQPTITQGQISNFSAANYCRFPFVVNFQNKPFIIDFELTTGNDVVNQRNILDSEFGLAFAIRQRKFIIAISTNGTNWNVGEGVGSYTVLPNTSYRIRMSWDGSQFVVAYSTDGGSNYIIDITKALTEQPYPKQIYIGVSSNQANWFDGIINLNHASLTISDKIVWQGMDDAGLATRMAVDMSNIDEEGVKKVKEIADTEKIKEGIKYLDTNKQDTIKDLEEIRLGSELGASSVQYEINDKAIAKDSTMEMVNNALILIAKAKGATIVSSLKEIQNNVKAGLGPILYPVGYKLSIEHSVYGKMIFVVTGHNQIASANGNPYTMTLVAQDCIANVQFDKEEAFYANATTAALAAGTYNITIGSSNIGGLVNGHTYMFTTPSALPIRGQFRFNTNGDGTINKVLGYASPESTSALFTVDLVEGSDGTNLGTIHNTDPTNNINARQRIGWGSNNYKESALRQFLNSNKVAGKYWLPQTKFDVAPSWVSTLDGFMKGLPLEFLDIVDVAEVKCSTNNFYESPDSTTPKNSKYTVYDKFFLPSRFEIYGSSDVVDDSVLMSYYNGATNKDRIKLLNGSARYWWLRTPDSGNAYHVRSVDLDGSLNVSGARYSLGCVPACIIA